MLDKETAYKDPFRYLRHYLGHKLRFEDDFSRYVLDSRWCNVHFEFADKATIPYIKGQEVRLVKESMNLMQMMEPDSDLSKSIPFPESDILVTLPSLTVLEDMRIATPKKFDDILASIAEDFFAKWNKWNLLLSQ